VRDDVTVSVGAASRWPGRQVLAGLRDALTRYPALIVTRYPVLVDVLFALALLLVLGMRGPARAASREFVIVFAVLLCAPLVLRRRYPLPVFGFMCGIAAVQWWSGVLLIGDAALLVALYTVAATCDRRSALAAAGVLEAGALLAALKWAPAISWLPSFVFLSGMVTAAFVIGVYVGTRRAYAASLEDRARRAERARIAREMHDIVAHNLSVMIALADGAAFAARTGSPEAEGAARQVSETGRQALAEMHRLLGVLREPEPAGSRAPQPGIDQLDDLVGQVRAAGLATSLTVTGQPFPLPGTAQLAVYRLVQEALTNVLKHADSPTAAHVRLRYAQPAVDLDITDDGRPKAHPADGGHGLTGMRERAAMFGGEVQAGPRPGGGWRVAVRLDTQAAS
jgi:signal transduction histidine kinase